eukprot:COSAG06_NODE_1000_length_11145_cov_9.091526_3_plen_158_part_00
MVSAAPRVCGWAHVPAARGWTRKWPILLDFSPDCPDLLQIAAIAFCACPAGGCDVHCGLTANGWLSFAAAAAAASRGPWRPCAAGAKGARDARNCTRLHLFTAARAIKIRWNSFHAVQPRMQPRQCSVLLCKLLVRLGQLLVRLGQLLVLLRELALR